MDSLALIRQGLRFGLMLQFAVGPVCMLVLSTSVERGFGPALSLIAAVTLADALYIGLSSLGAAALLRKPSVQRKARLFGGLVLIVFGAQLALNAFVIPLFPSVRLFSAGSGAGLFAQGLLLTLSNPLTILFWSGLLSAKVADNHWSGKSLLCFCIGCVLATVLFLTVIALMGSLLTGRITDGVMRTLNGVVGCALIWFGLRMSLQRNGAARAEP